GVARVGAAAVRPIVAVVAEDPTCLISPRFAGADEQLIVEDRHAEDEHRLAKPAMVDPQRLALSVVDSEMHVAPIGLAGGHPRTVVDAELPTLPAFRVVLAD